MKNLILGLAVSAMSCGAFAGDKGNGGDGVILDYERSYLGNSSVIRTRQWRSSMEYTLSILDPNNQKSQVYLLDLVDMGIESSIKINFDLNRSKDSKSICIDNSGCYNILNTSLFEDLINKNNFFGKRSQNSKTSPRLEYSVSSELSLAYDEYENQQSSYSKFQRVIHRSRMASYSSDLLVSSDVVFSYDEVKYKRLATKVEDSKNNYINMSKRHFKGKLPQFYSNEALLTVGIINKLEEIKNVNLELYNLLSETLLELDWMTLNLPLEEINDEGATASKITSKVQLASRNYGLVKITAQGWDKSFKINDKTIYPMNISNKVALIFHEVIYEITKNQGDLTSERARFINGYIFKSNNSSRNIEKALNILKK